MAWDFRYNRTNKSYIPVIPSATTTIGELACGRLVYMTSNSGESVTTVAIFESEIVGIVAIASTAGSTTPAQVSPVLPGDILSVDLTTNMSAVVSSNIGNLFRPANTSQIDGSTVVTVATSSDNHILVMTGFSTKAGKIYGYIPARLLRS